MRIVCSLQLALQISTREMIHSGWFMIYLGIVGMDLGHPHYSSCKSPESGQVALLTKQSPGVVMSWPKLFVVL